MIGNLLPPTSLAGLILLSFGLRLHAEPVDFTNDLIPVFTKLGCNAGACHGAAIGRGGFKLSLYGGNPDADHQAIVRQLRGRRVNLSRPEQSLLVLKPMEALEHGGGQLIEHDDANAALLVDWIGNGARHESARKLTRLEVSPKRHVAAKVGDAFALSAIAHYDDGYRRDVTATTVFKAEDESAVQIDLQSAIATPRRTGRHIVVSRFLNQVVPIEILVPINDFEYSPSDSPQGVIDTEIASSLQILGLSISGATDDNTYLRRVSLDLTGRLPTVDQAKAFLNNPSPAKRSELVDRLLQTEAYAEFWTHRLSKWLRIRPPGRDDIDDVGMTTYHGWLADQIRDDVGYDTIARQVLLASGDAYESGPANFYRTVQGPREQAEFVSELFMGSRLRCANCHNHPLDRWTQDDYHGLAAIFAKIESGRVIGLKSSGEVIHPRTLTAATPRIPGENFLPQEIADGRQAFADWLTDPSNPYFAKATVNRLWKATMGRGLVEPVDDFRDTNPATHPQLLSRLAEDFVTNGYQFRPLLKQIVNSQAYARSAKAVPDNKDDDRFYSHAIKRRLEPEVLADAITDVLGVAETYGTRPMGTRAVALISPKTPSQSLDVLGRCGRQESCESDSSATGGLPQKLHLFNGALLNARIAAPGGRLTKLIAGQNSPEAIQDEFYLAALSRKPTETERTFWNDQYSRNETPTHSQSFWEDFVWSLVTCNEFVMNH
ncbi:MAG: DUF1549 and DUF1553 domain-containing protein [Planctomycetota bacterium]